MNQVVVYLEPERHRSLKERAKLNRRTIGQQLIVEAFGLGDASPSAMPAKPRKRKEKA